MKTFESAWMKKGWAAVWLPAAILSAVAFCAPARAGQERKCDPRRDDTVYTIGYAHLDTQWRWTFQDSIYLYIGATMRDNFKLFEKYPGYRFNFTGSKRYMMMKEYYPEDFEKVREYVANGRWLLSGSSVDENDANVPSTESLVRNILYGNLYFKEEFGKISEDYMLPDCFGFPAFLPSVLAHAGMKGFSSQKLSWNSAAGIPFNVGAWEGPDGRSVVSALRPGTYSGKVSGDLSRDEGWLQRAREMGERTGFRADFKYYGTGDVGGAPTDDSVRWIQTALESDGPLCALSAQSDDYFQDVAAPEIEKMQRYKGDLLLVEHSAGSLSSQAYVKRWNRKGELLADGAERAALIADWLGAVPYPTRRLRGVWELVLGTQMHDILPGTSIPKAYEFSWNDQVMALNGAAGVIESSAGVAAAALDTDVEGTPLIVFNPLSSERTDVVQAKVEFPGGAPAAVRVFDPSGVEVPAQVAERKGDELEILFPARVPSVGYAVYDVRRAEAPGAFETGLKVTERSVENDRFRVEIDGNGDVSSVYDKKAGREALGGPAGLVLMEDKPRTYPAWNIDWEDWQKPPRAVVKGPIKARIVETGPVRAAIEVERKLEGSTFTQKIGLASGEAGDAATFDFSLDWRTPGSALKAAFPLSVSNENASYNLELGVIDRPTNEPRKYEVPSHQWFDLTDRDGSYGVSVLEDSKYASDKPSENEVRLTLVRTPGCTGYCDQATQDMGRHKVKYALAPHEGGWREGGSHWKALRLNQPLVAFAAEKRPGALGRSFSFLSVNSSQVAVRAAKKAEESDEIIVRLQELNGQPAAGVRVSFAAPVLSAREVDGQERPLAPARIEDGALAVDMEPFILRAFAVRIGKPAPEAAVPRPESVPVALEYNLAAATRDLEKIESGFDAAANAYSADLLPAEAAVNGVQFKLAQGGAGTPNAVACRGQEVRLPEGEFDALYLLASASDGDAEGVFETGGTKIPLRVQEWTGFVGQWDNRIWRSDREIHGLRPAYTKRDEIAWFASHHHNASGKNMAYNYSYLFLYTIDLPKGARSVKLPDNERIKVFAATTVRLPVNGAKPAQLLYDDFDKPEGQPNFSHAPGKYGDSVFVGIQPPWYSSYDEVRFTTDGSEPTKNSPLYKAPILINDRTVVKAAAFRSGELSGLIQLGQFEIDDAAPPALETARAFGEAAVVHVRFSEPVSKETAESPAHYAIEPKIGVKSAVLDSDGMTAALHLDAPPKEESEYTLTVHGVRDLSKRSNAMETPEAVVFKTALPGFRLKFRSKDINYSLGLPGVSRDYSFNGDPVTAGGPFGYALRLKGNRDCVLINDKPELNPETEITLAAWIRPKDWKGDRRILQKGKENNQYRLTAEDGELTFALTGVGQVRGPLPPAGEWRHVAGTYDGRRMRLYVNGVLAAEREASGPILMTREPLHLGAKNVNALDGDFFIGDMDRIEVWSVALPPEQIAFLARK